MLAVLSFSFDTIRAVGFDLHHGRNNTCNSCDNGSSRSKKPVALSYGPSDKVDAQSTGHDTTPGVAANKAGPTHDPLSHLQSISMHFPARPRCPRIAGEMAAFPTPGARVQIPRFQKMVIPILFCPVHRKFAGLKCIYGQRLDSDLESRGV